MGRRKVPVKAYDRYKAQGLCVKCGKPVESERAGLIECVTCAAKAGAVAKARYERYKSEHRCVVCGKQDKNTLGGRTRCFDCAVKGADRHKAYRERSKAKKRADCPVVTTTKTARSNSTTQSAGNTGKQTKNFSRADCPVVATTKTARSGNSEAVDKKRDQLKYSRFLRLSQGGYMDAYQIDELEQMARDFIDGNIDRKSVLKLNEFDMWYVLTLANAYSCTKIGTMSPKECVHYKYNIAKSYRQFVTLFSYSVLMHDLCVENTNKYSGKGCEVSKELAKDEPDAYVFISGLCELLDLLTGENVYLKLLVRKWKDSEFKKKCQLAVVEHGDKWREKYKSIHDEDYIVLLDKFFAAMDGGLAKVFAGIHEDSIRKASLRVPVKDDDSRGVSESIRVLYGKYINSKL